MRFKSFVSMGVAAVLIVPTLITAANPELAYAKTTSSKKVSAKAKSVIAKIKAINPKKSNYVTKTKSAVNAYKKLSSKDKKMVYNYGTLKKHWTTVQNRKAKQVITKIKAINSKKSDYVLKTKSALSAYNKLSKTDKKKVTNYSTLKKHWKNIQPYLKKVDAFNKSVATLNKTNFTTKSVTLEKQYDNLDSITKAAIPNTTLKKLSYYADVVETKTMVFKTLEAGSTNDSNTDTGSGISTTTTPEDGTKILTIINAYNKLSGAQQTLLEDLVDNSTDSNGEPLLQKLKRYLALEDVVKTAADIEKQYEALKPLNKAKAKDLITLYQNYDDAVKTVSKVDYNGKQYSFNDFVPDDIKAKITNIYNSYKKQITDAAEFNKTIAKLEAETETDPYTTISVTLPKYKIPEITDPSFDYPEIAPIDLADKTAVATYKKYELVPDIIDRFKKAKLPLLSSSSLTSENIAALVDLLPQYNKLGENQKSIVLNKLTADSDNAKDYLSEGKNLTSAQAIDKSYASAIKNKAKSSYFTDLKKVYDAYNTATSDVKRFVVNAANIIKIMEVDPKSDYNKALDAATTLQNHIETLNEDSKLSDSQPSHPSINEVIEEYKKMAKQVPTPLSLVDASALKTYAQFAAIPDVVKLVNKIPNKTEPTVGEAYGYKANNITDILSAVKAYKKLGSIQQVIVDNETNTKIPTIASLVGDESNIKEAQKIDSAYLKLKKSSKTYPKDAKKVYEAYGDLSEDAIKYLVNKVKIDQLTSAFANPQKIADDFAAKYVNPLNKNSGISDVNAAVKYYNESIEPNTQASDLVDKTVMKKYNEYAPVSNVAKLLSLINESDVSSPKVTPTDLYYIQKATIAYNALKPDPKMIIDAADRNKFPFLYETKNILAAAAIDKAYDKLKPTDDKYELELLDVYYNYYDRAPFAQKYVIHKKELENIGNIYKEPLAIAKEFETKVRNLSHISESGYTPTIKTVRNVEKYYFDNIKYNKINAKYNIPLSTLIPDDVMETYNKYALVLQIQDIAKSIFVLYGKLFNNQNVEFDKEKDYYYYYCNDALNKQSNHCYNDEYYENSKKGYTDSGKKAGNPIKITNPNDIKLIYKAIDYYQQLDAEQRAVLDKAPSSLTDTYYKDRYGGNKEPNTEEGDVHPSIPMSDGEIKNFLKAQEIDKEYEALNPSSKTYVQDAIVLYYKFKKAGKPVQLYTIHEKDLNNFRTGFDQENKENKLDLLIQDVDSFVKKVKLLSNDSELNDIKSVVNQYNNFNEAQLSVLEQGIVTKYNAYAPISEIEELTNKIKKVDTRYTDSSINNMLKAIAIYKKLSKDPKAIVVSKLINGSDSKYKYLDHETEIKAAQKVDNAFKKLDKTDDKYVVNLKKVKTNYDALNKMELSGLSDKTAQIYVTSNIDGKDGAVNKNIYKKPNEEAAEFEVLIKGTTDGKIEPWLEREFVPYGDIAEAVIKYNQLSTKAKSLVDDDVMKIYNKYAPVVTIVQTLGKIPIPDYSNLDDDKNTDKQDITGYYKSKKIDAGKDAGTEILNAIQLYNKLGADQKEIVMNTEGGQYNIKDKNGNDKIEYPLTTNQLNLLNESTNIKAAQALDKKITTIKPKSTSYVKGVIDAKKTLDLMPKEQRIYLQNVDILNGYLVDSYKNSTQTQKAIDDLKNFEDGVQQVDKWTSEMKNENGNIAACTDHTEPCNTTITKKMGELVTLFKQLNTPRLVDGSEITLASLIDRTKLARYQYFRAIYDVIDGLEK